MTIYTQTARFDHGQRALTEDELHRIAPSIFAEDAHQSRSERFAPIPTIEVIRSLGKEGFSVVGAKEANGRYGSKTHGKHLLRLRRLDSQVTVGDSVFEALLRNANDGSACYELSAGLFRVLCLNSLVAETPEMERLKVRHTGNVQQKVIEGAYEVLDRADEIADKSQRWRGLNLTDREKYAFARGALIERFGEVENQPGVAATNVKPEQMLVPRRHADTGRDLWSVFNVIQENALRGGIVNDSRHRRSTTREINGIDQSMQVNRGLWGMAEWLSRHAEAA